MPSPIDALAALRDGNARDAKPLRLKLDTGLSIDAPGARYLAEVFFLPLLSRSREVFRSGAAILARPSGSDAAPKPINQQDLAEELRGALLALPERSSAEAGRPYRDLRLFVAEAEPASVAAYVRDVVVGVRALAPTYRAPKARRERGPAKSTAELKAAQRERQRAQAKAAAEAWLLDYLANDAEPGARVMASDLYEIAESDNFSTADFQASHEPGPRQFYAVADEILGTRRYSHGQRFYVIPEPATNKEEDLMPDLLADAVFDRVVEKIAASVEAEILDRLRSGDRIGALLLQRDRHGATGTDGGIVDFEAARARRR